MLNLSEWLQHNQTELVDTAVIRLAQDVTLQSQIIDSVESFFDGLLRSVKAQSAMPLNVIMIDWLEARSAPSTSELTSLVPLLATLKQVIWEQILQRCSPEQALALLSEMDALFTETMIYLANLENDTLLEDMRRQLQKAQADVKRLDMSKSNFIAVAAHELRTPLTLVEGYGDMIANLLLSSGDPQVPLLLEGIDNGTQRLKEIINDLIDVSLLDMKLMEFHFQQVFLHQVLTAIERIMTKVLSNRQINLQIERETISSELTYADPDRLLQVMQKVLTNAVKYTPDGGTVLVRGRDLPGFTDIMVMDTGIGISPSNLPRIFDTFSALGNTALHSSGKTKFKGGGPGLGLPIARGIIEAHGGTIWAESAGYDEAKCPGSTFHIMVPMHTSPLESPVWRVGEEIHDDFES